MELRCPYWLFVLFLLALYPDGTLQLCNCNDGKCLADGSCEKGYTCKENFFGAFCEYLNALNQSTLPQPELSDQDLTTCAVINGDFKISYTHMRLYMARLIVSNNNLSENINFTFKNHTEENYCNGHVLRLETNVIEFYCEKMMDSQELIITGIDGNEVCHVYLTEGRNMIENATIVTKWLESDTSFYTKAGLTDGIKDHIAGACFLTLAITGPKTSDTLTFNLRTPSFVNYVEVYGNAALGDESLLLGAIFMFIDKNRRFRFDFEVKSLHTKRYYSEPGVAIRSVRVLKTRRFGVCEVEIVGDCTNGFYGHNCSSICKPRCKDSRCTTQGVCISCLPGLVGHRCCKEFCAPDKDCGDFGSCINGCVNKKYGLDCDKECSLNCAGDGTCDVNGTCTHGCKIGYFGHDCSLACSPNCGGLGDCNVNGSCISPCKPGYFGHDCTKYPIGCNCDDFMCTSDFTCEPDYQCKNKTFGYYCEYGEIEIDQANEMEVQDGDLETCTGVSGDLIISYNETRVYMVRVVVEDSSTLKKLKFTFKGIPSQAPDHGEECDGQVVILEKTVIEYYCKRLVVSQTLVIQGIGGKIVCHVHLTEGRNVIQGATIWTSSNSTDSRYYEIEGLINGVRENVKGSCFLTKPFTQNKHISVYLKAPMFLNLAYVYGLSADNTTYRMDADFSIEDNRNRELQRFVWNDPTYKLYYQRTDLAVSRLFGIISHPFGACEIEFIGDCGFGRYGLHCNLTCSKRCKDSRCTIQGHCIGCKEGFAGRQCCKEFCDPDQPCDEHGNCINGCVKGKYGFDCTKDCSPYCAENGTCDEEGVCHSGCKNEFYGPQCLFLALPSHMSRRETMTCHCTGGKCKHPRDTCNDFENCITGWFGYSCAYKDLAVSATTSDAALNDNDANTCIREDDKHAKAEWTEQVMFSFVVLTFREDADIGKFIVLTRDMEIKDRFTEDQIRSKMLKKHVFQVDILTRMMIDEVTVSWSGEGALCTLNVGGDRNLALEMGPVLAKSPELGGMIVPVTDGDISGTNCLSGNQMSLLFPFDGFIFVSRVVLYPDLSRNSSAELSLFGSLSGRPATHVVHTITGNRFSTATFETKQYDTVDISVTNDSSGTLRICEVEIFGECHPPYYGFACIARCPDYCPQEECDYEGHCLYEVEQGMYQARSSSSIEKAYQLYCAFAMILHTVKMALI